MSIKPWLTPKPLAGGARHIGDVRHVTYHDVKVQQSQHRKACSPELLTKRTLSKVLHMHT